MVTLETLRETTLAEPILTVQGVSRGFARSSGEVRVLEDVDLSLRSGEIVGLLGRSGSGKVDPAAHYRRSDQARRR